MLGLGPGFRVRVREFVYVLNLLDLLHGYTANRLSIAQRRAIHMASR